MNQPSLLGPRPIMIIRNYDRPRERSRSRERNLPRERSRSRERNLPRERSRSRSRERNWSRDRSRELNWPRERSRSRSQERNWPRERNIRREHYRPTEINRESYLPECNNTLNGRHCYNAKCIFRHPRGYIPGPRTRCFNYPHCNKETCNFGHWISCPYEDGDFRPNIIQSNYFPFAITTMPKILKQQVWDKRYGAQCGTGYCFCCRYVVIRMDDFQVGHVVAKSKGGLTTIDNLEPICSRCNDDMKTMNLYEYQAKFHPQPVNVSELLSFAIK